MLAALSCTTATRAPYHPIKTERGNVASTVWGVQRGVCVLII